MTLISIALVLILEQWHALPVDRVVRQPFVRLCDWVEVHLNDGQAVQGGLAWAILAAIPSLLVLVLSVMLARGSMFWSFALGVLALYLTIGLRHFSHQFTEIQQALQLGEIGQARSMLAIWRQQSGDRLSSIEVARLSIERGLIDAHRHVFAPLFWFAVLGPAGAVLYRLAQMLNDVWGNRSKSDIGRFGDFSRQAFIVIDWIPARLTAASFAVVGDFEDAAHCWRTQAGLWPDSTAGHILASGAGALGVRLGLPVPDPSMAKENVAERPELGLGDDADPEAMQRAVGLVWRTLLMALLLLAVMWISSWADF